MGISILAGIIISIVPYITEKTVIFGVRSPPGKYNSPAVRKIRISYMVTVLIITALAELAGYTLYRYPVVEITIPLVIIAAAFCVYLFDHYRILRMKSTEGWLNGNGGIVIGEFATGTSRLFPWLYAIPGLIVMVAIFTAGIVYYPAIPAEFATHYGISGAANQYASKSVITVFTLPFTGLALTASMMILGYLISRTGIRSDRNDSSGSYRVNIFRKRMAEMIIVIPVFTNVTFFLSALKEWKIIENISISLLVAPVIIMVVVVVMVSALTGQAGSNLRISDSDNRVAGIRESTTTKDDDRYWRGGVLYVNRNDGRLMVPKRFGAGYTLNFGHPSGMAIFAILISLPVLVILLLVFLKGM